MRKNLQNITIFLSSPGDVQQERQVAYKVINKLNSSPLLRDTVSLEIVSWDKPDTGIPMLASVTPQEAINRGMKMPAECDIVLVILWGRFGTPLAISALSKPDGSQYLSGTEWEFLNAQEQSRKSGKPFILLYRRTEKVLLDPDVVGFEAQVTQRKRVNDFFNSLVNPDGSIQYGYSSYTAPPDFESLLEQNLVELIVRLMKGDSSKHPTFPFELVKQDGEPVRRFKLCVSQNGAPERTAFLLPAHELVFGMAKREKSPDVDVVLRLLPCRSAQADPVNWEATARISKVHGRLRAVGNQVQLMDVSRNGIILDKTSAVYDALDSLGDHLELYGTESEASISEGRFLKVNKNAWLPIPDQVEFTLGENILKLRIDTFRAPATRDVEVVRLSRLSNTPQHEYLLVSRRLQIGNSPTCALHVDLPYENTVAAEFVVIRGRLYVSALMERVVTFNGLDLAPNVPVQIYEKDILKLHDVSLLFDQALDEDFVTAT